MSDHESKEPDREEAPEESTIRRYLLGLESQEERQAIEERLMTDRSYSQRLDMVESDLADDYVRGSLAGIERERLEHHFLAAPARRQKVRIAAALRDRVAAAPANRSLSGVESQPVLPRRSLWKTFPIAGLAAAAAIIAAIAIGLLVETLRLRNDLRLYQANLQEQQTRITSLTGEIELAEARQSELEHELSSLSAEPEAQVTLSDNGIQIALDRQGRLSGLEATRADLQQTIKASLATGRVRAPASVSELAGTASVLMGPGEGVAFPLVSPLATVVSEQQPSFRWGRLEGATGYTVSIYDADFKRIARSEEVNDTAWRLPIKLERGVVYTWQVTAVRNGEAITSPVKPAPEARFKVLDNTTAGELDLTRKTSRGSHLALGIAYARAGLREEAERELELLLKENPGSPVASALLRSVRGWVRGK